MQKFDKNVFDELVNSMNIFTYAMIKLPDGTLLECEIKDYVREPNTNNIKVNLKKGKGTYFTHTSNIVLYNK